MNINPSSNPKKKSKIIISIKYYASNIIVFVYNSRYESRIAKSAFA